MSVPSHLNGSPYPCVQRTMYIKSFQCGGSHFLVAARNKSHELVVELVVRHGGGRQALDWIDFMVVRAVPASDLHANCCAGRTLVRSNHCGDCTAPAARHEREYLDSVALRVRRPVPVPDVAPHRWRGRCRAAYVGSRNRLRRGLPRCLPGPYRDDWLVNGWNCVVFVTAVPSVYVPLTLLWSILRFDFHFSAATNVVGRSSSNRWLATSGIATSGCYIWTIIYYIIWILYILPTFYFDRQ